MSNWKWLGTPAFAGALLLGGCSDRSDVQRQREEVAESRADLEETRREASGELAKQRAEAQQETAEARQEMQEEISGQREEVREEEQELTEAQRELMEEEQGIGGAGPERAPLAASGTVTGKLDSTLGQNLKLIDSQNRTVELNTNDSTRVTFNGQAAKLDDFEPGTEIRASYRAEGEEHVATSVQIVKPASKKLEHKPLE